MKPIAPATDYGDLATWLEARSGFIGASESPAICGVGYANQSPYTIWLAKTGQETEELDGELLECGKVLQPAILELASRRIGAMVYDPGEFTVYRQAERPHVGATLDGMVMDMDNVKAAVEAKNISGFLHADWEADEPPLRVNVQLQQQMYCADLERGYAVGLLGGNRVEVKRVNRDEEFLAALLPRLDAFWELVQSNTPPPVDGSEATSEALKRLYATPNGQTIDLPGDAAGWDRSLQRAKANVKRWETVRRETENRIKAAMGEAEVGELPCGALYTYRLQTNRYKAREAHEASFRVLRRKKG